ncbi:MAG: hypothetical protein IJX49_00310 [Clostridia bacterium]|nr:hypothetical protein [Clostridia bacterium]
MDTYCVKAQPCLYLNSAMSKRMSKRCRAVTHYKCRVLNAELWNYF